MGFTHVMKFGHCALASQQLVLFGSTWIAMWWNLTTIVQGKSRASFFTVSAHCALTISVSSCHSIKASKQHTCALWNPFHCSFMCGHSLSMWCKGWPATKESVQAMKQYIPSILFDFVCQTAQQWLPLLPAGLPNSKSSMTSGGHVHLWANQPYRACCARSTKKECQTWNTREIWRKQPGCSCLPWMHMGHCCLKPMWPLQKEPWSQFGLSICWACWLVSTSWMAHGPIFFTMHMQRTQAVHRSHGSYCYIQMKWFQGTNWLPDKTGRFLPYMLLLPSTWPCSSVKMHGSYWHCCHPL